MAFLLVTDWGAFFGADYLGASEALRAALPGIFQLQQLWKNEAGGLLAIDQAKNTSTFKAWCNEGAESGGRALHAWSQTKVKPFKPIH